MMNPMVHIRMLRSWFGFNCITSDQELAAIQNFPQVSLPAGSAPQQILTDLNNLADKVKTAIGTSPDLVSITYRNCRCGDVNRRQLDISGTRSGTCSRAQTWCRRRDPKSGCVIAWMSAASEEGAPTPFERRSCGLALRARVARWHCRGGDFPINFRGLVQDLADPRRAAGTGGVQKIVGEAAVLKYYAR